MSVMPQCRDLPAPPPGKTGWPWTIDAPRAGEKTSGGFDWPKITLVTPSFNQGAFIEEAIRSALLQGYPNLEYIVMDGGSTDESVSVIRKYASWLTHWVSERDKGQSDAINRGLARGTGEIFGWLCSDDYLYAGVLQAVGEQFASDPSCGWFSGAGDIYYCAEGVKETCPSGLCSATALLEYWRFGSRGHYICQPSTFWRRELWERVGGVRVDNHLAMDYELWLAFEELSRHQASPEPFSFNRIHASAKTGGKRRQQILATMDCALAAARRRGLSAFALNARMLPWIVPNRLRRIARNLKVRWFGGAAREALDLIRDPFRMWTAKGRVNMLKRPDEGETP